MASAVAPAGRALHQDSRARPRRARLEWPGRAFRRAVPAPAGTQAVPAVLEGTAAIALVRRGQARAACFLRSPPSPGGRSRPSDPRP